MKRKKKVKKYGNSEGISSSKRIRCKERRDERREKTEDRRTWMTET